MYLVLISSTSAGITSGVTHEAAYLSVTKYRYQATDINILATCVWDKRTSFMINWLKKYLVFLPLTSGSPVLWDFPPNFRLITRNPFSLHCVETRDRAANVLQIIAKNFNKHPQISHLSKCAIL